MAYSEEKYKQITYGSVPIDEENLADLTPVLVNYLPHYYKYSPITGSIQSGFANELGLVYYSIEDLLKQLFVNTTTWGIERWETFLGIKPEPDKPLAHRREVVMAKIRGAGTTTREMVQRVASAFAGGMVDIYEHHADYHFVVKFVGVRGIPPNLGDLTNSIEEIKPAHLGFSYAYTYTVWQELAEWNVSWTEANQFTWDELSTRVLATIN